MMMFSAYSMGKSSMRGRMMFISQRTFKSSLIDDMVRYLWDYYAERSSSAAEMTVSQVQEDNR